ncbi:ribonuclease E inhibitor RraB [Alkalicoccus luteus]|uniref:Ribonuclease E inhibitor RraB n=1 Tax=Alkalicoccus luteus TaxID=1237094 RepID=A0A969TVX9_9BACI|nr:ribonuclease E inhibitor RraB [Alkalicoccus luteus]NJP38587.1 ribonuclease E inhibitor RraB [Alkalicoccus luteus]
MTIKMSVYFQNENDAESLSASLKKFGINNERVERVPEDGSKEIVVIPAAGISGGSATGQGGHPGIFQSLSKLRETMTADKGSHADYVLEFEAPEENKQAIVEKIKQTEGYVTKDMTE